MFGYAIAGVILLFWWAVCIALWVLAGFSLIGHFVAARRRAHGPKGGTVRGAGLGPHRAILWGLATILGAAGIGLFIFQGAWKGEELFLVRWLMAGLMGGATVAIIAYGALARGTANRTA